MFEMWIVGSWVEEKCIECCWCEVLVRFYFEKNKVYVIEVILKYKNILFLGFSLMSLIGFRRWKRVKYELSCWNKDNW